MWKTMADNLLTIAPTNNEAKIALSSLEDGSAGDFDRIRLLLGSAEIPTGIPKEGRIPDKARNTSSLMSTADKVARKFLAKIWHERAGILGGAPTIVGVEIKTIPLKKDGRSFFFSSLLPKKMKNDLEWPPRIPREKRDTRGAEWDIGPLPGEGFA